MIDQESFEADSAAKCGKCCSQNSQQGTLKFDVDPVFDSVFTAELTEVNSVLNSDGEILDIKGKRRWQIARNGLCVLLLRILLVYFKLDLSTCRKVVHGRNLY